VTIKHGGYALIVVMSGRLEWAAGIKGMVALNALVKRNNKSINVINDMTY
jgi:hypothetical protein